MYVEEDDLLLGELTDTLPATIDVTRYLAMAAQEIDGKLGVLYAVPVDYQALPNAQGGLLSSIHRKLTSGRIIMAATAHMADSHVHAYGLSLVKEAQMELMAVANGDVVLIGAERVDGDGDPRGDIDDAEIADPLARVPSGTNRDTVSAVEQFEENFMQDDLLIRSTVPWEPGV